MILLPRGNPVKEKIDPQRVNLPAAFSKLQAGRFTGYLRFECPDGTGIIIFSQGRLISTLLEGSAERLIANEALTRIFEQSVAGGARLDIYKLSPDLAISIHALLHGHVAYRGQELKLIDIKALLTKMKDERISGCLRIYTNEHVALIFYRDGQPLGFFHDGSTDLETTADTSMSVARLPGAKVDLLVNRYTGSVLSDLLESADLSVLWQTARESFAQQQQVREAETSRSLETREKDQRKKILELFRSTAQQHIGKIGASLVDKEFEKNVPVEGPFSDISLGGFYAGLGQAARLVAGSSAIKAMLEEMDQHFNDAQGA